MFSQICFLLRDFIIIVRLLLATLRIRRTAATRQDRKIVVWNYDTFDNDLVIKKDFTKYLKEAFCNILINISPLNVIGNMLLPERIYHYCQTSFGRCENRANCCDQIRIVSDNSNNCSINIIPH